MGHVTAGPLTSWLIKPFGADIVKIERPGSGEGGRDVRSPSEESDEAGYYFHSKNADKESVSVDIKDDHGREIVLSLAREADVIVENFAPGNLDRFGLGYEDVRAVNESVIHCSISGFGHDNHEKDQRAYDSIMQAMSGLMSVTGYDGDPPTKLGPSVMDNLGGYVAATAILAAVAYRDRTGEGQHIDISMQDCAAWLMQYRLPFDNERTDHQPARSPATPAGVFETADGWITVSVPDNGARDQFADLVEDSASKADVGSTTDTSAEREELVATWAADQSAAEAVAACRDCGLFASEVLTIDDVADSKHLHDRDALREVDCGQERKLLPESVFATALPGRTDPASRGGPALGEHTEEVLSDVLGYEDDKIERLRSDGIVE